VPTISQFQNSTLFDHITSHKFEPGMGYDLCHHKISLLAMSICKALQHRNTNGKMMTTFTWQQPTKHWKRCASIHQSAPSPTGHGGQAITTLVEHDCPHMAPTNPHPPNAPPHLDTNGWPAKACLNWVYMGACKQQNWINNHPGSINIATSTTVYNQMELSINCLLETNKNSKCN
jgi:hypothetical protein